MKGALIHTRLILTVANAATAAIPYEPVITVPVYVPAPSGREFAATASEGREVLLVWNDLGRRTLDATRLAADGTVLDDRGVRIEFPVRSTEIRCGSSGPEMRLCFSGTNPQVCIRRVSRVFVRDAPPLHGRAAAH